MHFSQCESRIYRKSQQPTEGHVVRIKYLAMEFLDAIIYICLFLFFVFVYFDIGIARTSVVFYPCGFLPFFIFFSYNVKNTTDTSCDLVTPCNEQHHMNYYPGNCLDSFVFLPKSSLTFLSWSIFTGAL